MMARFFQNNSVSFVVAILLLTACAQNPQTVIVSGHANQKSEELAILEDPDGRQQFVAIVDGRYTARTLTRFGSVNDSRQAIESGVHSVVVHDDVQCRSPSRRGLIDFIISSPGAICDSAREPKCVAFNFRVDAGRTYQYARNGAEFFLIDSETNARVAKGEVSNIDKDLSANSARCRSFLPPLSAEQDIDIERYMGKWHIVAYAPSAYSHAPVSYNADLTAFMRENEPVCASGYVEYTLGRSDNSAPSFLTSSVCADDNENRNTREERWCIDDEANAGVYRTPWPGVSLTSPFKSRYACSLVADAINIDLRPDTYWIVALDEDYQWSLVSNPFRRDTRILSRKPRLSDDALKNIVTILEREHHNPCWLIVSSREQAAGQPRLCDYMNQISQAR